MEAIYVLSDEREVLCMSFDFDEDMMRGVRSAFRDGRSPPVAKALYQSWVMSNRLRGCEFFYAMIFPKASFTSKGGDTALGKDASSGEDKEGCKLRWAQLRN